MVKSSKVYKILTLQAKYVKFLGSLCGKKGTLSPPNTI